MSEILSATADSYEVYGDPVLELDSTASGGSAEQAENSETEIAGWLVPLYSLVMSNADAVRNWPWAGEMPLSKSMWSLGEITPDDVDRIMSQIQELLSRPVEKEEESDAEEDLTEDEIEQERPAKKAEPQTSAEKQTPNKPEIRHEKPVRVEAIKDPVRENTVQQNPAAQKTPAPRAQSKAAPVIAKPAEVPVVKADVEMEQPVLAQAPARTENNILDETDIQTVDIGVDKVEAVSSDTDVTEIAGAAVGIDSDSVVTMTEGNDLADPVQMETEERSYIDELLELTEALPQPEDMLEELIMPADLAGADLLPLAPEDILEEEVVYFEHTEEAADVESAPGIDFIEDDLEEPLSLAIEDQTDDAPLAEIPGPDTIFESLDIIQEAEEVLALLAESIDSAEPELTESVNEVLDKIIETPAKLYEMTDEAVNIEEAQKDLEELFIELFVQLDIEYDQELIDALVYMVLRVRLADDLDAMKTKETEAVQDKGTHEIIKKLLAGLRNLKRAVTRASAIGKSALRLYISENRLSFGAA